MTKTVAAAGSAWPAVSNCPQRINFLRRHWSTVQAGRNLQALGAATNICQGTAKGRGASPQNEAKNQRNEGQHATNRPKGQMELFPNDFGVQVAARNRGADGVASVLRLHFRHGAGQNGWLQLNLFLPHSSCSETR